MNKRALIDKLQVRLNEINAQLESLEPCFDRTALLGRNLELLSTISTILDMPEEI